jgi:galactokinase
VAERTGLVDPRAAIDRGRLADHLRKLEPAVDPAGVEVVRSPGRVNLIGEYTDINEGFVLPAAIDLEIRIAYSMSDDRTVRLHRLAVDRVDTAEFDLDDLPARSDTWIDYAVGVAAALIGAGLEVRGLRGVIASTLPVGAGLSSSAAIEMAVAHALLGEESADVDRLEVARLGQRAENEYVGVESGLMDQFAANCGREGAALLLDCRSLEWRPVPLGSGLRLVVLDTGSPRQLTTSAYNERSAQCQAAVAAFRREHPSVRALRDVDQKMLDQALAKGLLDPVVARRAQHIVAENERVLRTVAALETGDMAAVGEAFAASHASLRDLFEVSSPALDAMVEIASATAGVVAARMTGAGFGGCTVNLVEPGAVDALRSAVEEHYPARTGLTPRMYAVRAVRGAGALEA